MAGAAVALVTDASDAEGRKLRQDFMRKGRVRPMLLDDRPDMLFAEGPDLSDDRLFVGF